MSIYIKSEGNNVPHYCVPHYIGHTGRKDRVATLEKLLHKALADKGIVYIPAFSLGRTQELIYEINRIGDMNRFRELCHCESALGRRGNLLSQTNPLTKIPVFLDSLLGLKITKIYSDLEQFWDKEAKNLKARGDHPIDFKNLYSVEKYRDHQRPCHNHSRQRHVYRRAHSGSPETWTPGFSK